MSNLDVALRLRLINQLGGPAKDAKRELEGVGAAAKKLSGSKADGIARHLVKTKAEAKGAEVALQRVTASAKRLDGAGADRLTARLRNATGQSDRLAQSLRRARHEANSADHGGKVDPAFLQRQGRGGGAILAGGTARMMGAVGGAYAAFRVAGAVKQSFQDFAELDRRMTRLGNTAEATKDQVKAATVNVRAMAQKYGAPVEEVLAGLEDLVTQGKELSVAEAMLDPIVQAAQASGAAVKDMAATSGAMLNNLKITAEQLPGAFDKLAYAGKKGQFELKGMAQYFPELGAGWARAGQEGINRLGDLGAALQTVRKQTGSDEKTFASIRDLLTKIDSTDVQNNFKKMGVDLDKELRKAKKEGKPLFDTLIELTERATKKDMSLLPKLFTENESRTAIYALISLKDEFRSLREEINTKSAGTIISDIAPVATDAQSAIQRLSNAWSAAGIAAGKFVAEATPAVGLLERISRGIDGAREYMSGEGDKGGKKDAPRVDEPAGPKSSYPGRFQSAAHAKATREALVARPPKLSDFSGRNQSQDFTRAKAKYDRDQRANLALRGPFSPKANYSPVTPDAITAARKSMAGITRVIASEGAKADAEAKAIADSIKARFDFTAHPRISPRFDGPATTVPPDARQHALPEKRAQHSMPERHAGRPIHIVNHITVQGGGKDGRQIGQDIARQLAQLGNNSGALFDTV